MQVAEASKAERTLSIVLVVAGLTGYVTVLLDRTELSLSVAVGASTAAIAAGVVILQMAFWRRPVSLAAITEAIDARLRVSEQAAKIGLVDCVPDCSLYDYSRVLSESQSVTIVLNDGNTWTSLHRDRLRRRIEDATRVTTVFLIHPESKMLPILARKGSIDVPTLTRRIRETVTLLTDISTDSSKLEILGHHFFNPHSLVIADDRAFVIPYYTSRGGRTVPLFVFEDIGSNCFYRELVSDMEALRMDSELIGNVPPDVEVRSLTQFRAASG